MHFSPFSGLHWVEGPNCSFNAASKGWGIRVLSSETIGHFLKNKIQLNILFNHKCSSCTFSAMLFVYHFTHDVIKLEKSHVVSSSSVYSGSKRKGRAKKSISYFPPNFNIIRHLFYLFCKGLLTFFARSLCKHWVGTSAYDTLDLSNMTTSCMNSGMQS